MPKMHPNGYWNYERCFAEAKKYKTITEFAKYCGAAEKSARRNGWTVDYTWFVDGHKLASQKKKKWNYDNCYRLALECSKKSEMKSKSSQAFKIALENGWIKDYIWFLSTQELRHQKRPTRVKWPYEKCREIALQFTTLTEFQKKYPSCYVVSKRNGWVDDFDWLGRDAYTYTQRSDNVYAYFFDDLKSVYVGRSVNPSERDHAHNTSENSSVFRFASQHEILIPKMVILESELTIKEGLEKEDYYRDKFLKEGWNVLNIAKTGIKSGSVGLLASGKWNYNACEKESKKYSTLKDFRKICPSAYNAAVKNGWVDNYSWLARSGGGAKETITYDMCYGEAKKYNTRSGFSKGNAYMYAKALEKGWIDDYIWLAPSATAKKWDYEKCYEEAKKYKKLADFRINCGRAYSISKVNGWINDYTWLEKKDISQKMVLQFTLDGELVAKYNGVREACRLNGFDNGSVSRCCNGILNQHKGYIFRYGEE